MKFATFSAYALIAANAIPLLGVLFFQWDLQVVMVLYWLENVIIGVLNIVKLLLVTEPVPIGKRFKNAAFFAVHYGIFCFAHAAFMFHLLEIELPLVSAAQWLLVTAWLQLHSAAAYLWQLFGVKLSLGLAALALSHGYSLFEHFFQQGERQSLSQRQLMRLPYRRIVVLHIALIFGAILISELGSQTALLFALVVVKTVLDVKAHRREHQSHAPDLKQDKQKSKKTAVRPKTQQRQHEPDELP